MKKICANSNCRRDEFHESPAGARFGKNGVGNNYSREAGFTLVEIAICLAIIGFALVAIMATLPMGMNTQRANREETVIGQDAAMLLPLIAHGSRGADDLTNYVYAIVNTGSRPVGYINPVVAGQMNFSKADFPSVSTWYPILTNGANIIGLLGTPQFTDSSYNPTNIFFSINYSNRIYACIRSMSGLAAEKPPQNNAIMVGDTFSYRVLCLNAPVALDTNTLTTTSGAFSTYNQQLSFNQHELRMTYLWPQLPNGSLPPIPTIQTFRATIAGQLARQVINGFNLYFYQPQSFVAAP
jgi:prepilin-type N-terminal cleavage/methylation domain-containing protein